MIDLGRWLVLGTVALALAEYVTAFFAPAWYFRTGLRVYRKRFEASDLTAEQLGERIRTKAPWRLHLRDSGSAGFGLRENFLFYLLYSALLHWQIRPCETGRGWMLVGRYKVWTTAFGAMMVVQLLQTFQAPRAFWIGMAFVAWLGLISAAIVLIQRWQVQCVDRILEAHGRTQAH
jgi:hypothetical protein